MRYLYYILGIFILATAVFAFIGRDRASVEVSRPALVINDRIITEAEIDKRLADKPHDMTEEQYIDSLIMQELLIQEALDRDIHQEESFRRSVESFYEQSLVKTLLDRQYRDFNPEVTDREVEKYKRLSGMDVEFTRRTYNTRSEAQNNENPSAVHSKSSPFVFLSDHLRFVFLTLAPGQTSAPRQTDEGYVTYRLDQTRPLKKPAPAADMDTQRIRNLIADQKQERLYDKWAENLRQQADIRRPR